MSENSQNTFLKCHKSKVQVRFEQFWQKVMKSYLFYLLIWIFYSWKCRHRGSESEVMPSDVLFVNLWTKAVNFKQLFLEKLIKWLINWF